MFFIVDFESRIDGERVYLSKDSFETHEILGAKRFSSYERALAAAGDRLDVTICNYIVKYKVHVLPFHFQTWLWVKDKGLTLTINKEDALGFNDVELGVFVNEGLLSMTDYKVRIVEVLEKV